MHHEFLQLKNTFEQQLIKYKIPTQNRADLYFKLADAVEEQPKNEVLMNLFITALADVNLYISYFEQYELSEYPDLINTVHSRIKKLRKAIEKERCYEEFWGQILFRKTTPPLKEFDSCLNKQMEAEALKLSKIFCEYFEIEFRKSGELLHNLRYFVHLSYSYPIYRKIAPFYFWRIMLKH